MPLVVPGKTSNVERKCKDAKAASESLVQLEDEQREKELELEKLTAELQLGKLRTDDARKVAVLNKARADAAEQVQQPMDDDTVRSFLEKEGLEASPEAPMENKEHAPTIAPIRLKGVDLPKFSRESDYETWKAAFSTVVDRFNIPVAEKMLKLLVRKSFNHGT